MKTTSILTITGALSIGLLTFLNFHGHDKRADNHPDGNKTIIASEPLNEDVIFTDIVSANAGTGISSSAGLQPKASVAGETVCGDEVIGSEDLCLDAIVYIETEEPVDLGFDTSEYLPAGFNPYANGSEALDLGTIVYIEETDDISLGFDTAAFLPLGFNPYAGMEPDLSEIVFIETEEPVDLGFDTSSYLPEGFDPYSQPELQLDDIVFLELNEKVDLGFDVDAYLPVDFDPYAMPEFDLDEIPFMEMDDEVEPWQEGKPSAHEAAINL
jgi:hypothetical protein